jgi:hypothetical protein
MKTFISNFNRSLHSGPLQMATKQPLNAYLRYIQIYRPQVKSELPNATPVEILNELTRRWNRFKKTPAGFNLTLESQRELDIWKAAQGLVLMSGDRSNSRSPPKCLGKSKDGRACRAFPVKSSSYCCHHI